MNKGITIAIVSFLLVLSGAVLYVYKNLPKTASVNFITLYDSFEMKKQYEKEFEKVQQGQQKTMDSLQFELKTLAEEVKHQKSQELAYKFEKQRNEYLYKQEFYARETEEKMQDYKDKIMKQLKVYVKSYGDAKGYDYIFGVDDGYAVLYKKDGKDITNELIGYVNQQFKGLR